MDEDGGRSANPTHRLNRIAAWPGFDWLMDRLGVVKKLVWARAAGLGLGAEKCVGTGRLCCVVRKLACASTLFACKILGGLVTFALRNRDKICYEMNVPLRECGEEDLDGADSVLQVVHYSTRRERRRLAKTRAA